MKIAEKLIGIEWIVYEILCGRFIAHRGKTMSQTTGDKAWHLPVLPDETIDGWHREGGTTFIDGTVGGGGHTAMLLERFPQTRVLGIDRDRESIERATQTLERFGERVILRQGSYADIPEHLAAVGWSDKVDGILLDLGVNSHQLDEAERGFSFLHDGPLDMRFQSDSAAQPTAADIVNQWSERDLVKAFREWGEEPQAKRAARAIIEQRKVRPFERTGELRDCLHQALYKPKRKRPGIDPATLVFQALRIAVNREFDHLETFLTHFPEWLTPGGRIAVISFHSLEDRRVKQAFRRFTDGCTCPSDFPMCVCGFVPQLKILTSKPIRPSDEEVEVNSRSRSSKLRVAEAVNESA